MLRLLTRHHHRAAVGWALGLAACLAARPALAQDPLQGRPERPYRGLFGSAGGGQMRQSLSVTGAMGAGYDFDILTGPGSSSPGLTSQWPSSGFLSASGRLLYAWGTPRVGVSASVGSMAAHYTQGPQSITTRHNGNLSASWQITPRTRLSAHQNAGYWPIGFPARFPVPRATEFQKSQIVKMNESLFQEFGPGVQLELAPTAIVIDPGSPARVVGQTAWMGSTQLTHQMWKRITLSARYGRGSTRSALDHRTLTNQTLDGGITFTVGKGLGLRMDYARLTDIFKTAGQVERVSSHTINFGVDFNRALTVSLSRRASLMFATGINVLTDRDTHHFRLGGRADFNYEMGRSWSAGLAFSRDAGYVQTFRAPMLSDALTGGVGGLVGRRLNVNAGLGATRGSVGFGPDDTFTAYYGSAGLQYALTRHLALGVNYGHHRYTFAPTVPLPTGLSRQTSRQTLHVTVNVWAPILQQRRRS